MNTLEIDAHQVYLSKRSLKETEQASKPPSSASEVVNIIGLSVLHLVTSSDGKEEKKDSQKENKIYFLNYFFRLLRLSDKIK